MYNATPLQAYQQQAMHSWTRIDLLLALYDTGIQALQAGAAALRTGDEDLMLRQRSRAQRVLIEVLDGLNPNYPETTDRIRQLVLFVFSCIASKVPDRWEASARVLQTLRSGYETVREDAVAFEEQQGVPTTGEGRIVSELV